MIQSISLVEGYYSFLSSWRIWMGGADVILDHTGLASSWAHSRVWSSYLTNLQWGDVRKLPEERLRLYALASLADCASSASLSKYIAAGTLGRLVGWILINSLADQYRQFSSGLWYERGTPPKLSVATKDVLHCLLQTIFSLQDCPRTWYGR